MNSESDIDYKARYFAECSVQDEPICYCVRCGDVETLTDKEWCADCREAHFAALDAHDAEQIAYWGNFVPTRGRR